MNILTPYTPVSDNGPEDAFGSTFPAVLRLKRTCLVVGRSSMFSSFENSQKSAQETLCILPSVYGVALAGSIDKIICLFGKKVL